MGTRALPQDGRVANRLKKVLFPFATACSKLEKKKVDGSLALMRREAHCMSCGIQVNRSLTVTWTGLLYKALVETAMKTSGLHNIDCCRQYSDARGIRIDPPSYCY